MICTLQTGYKLETMQECSKLENFTRQAKTSVKQVFIFTYTVLIIVLNASNWNARVRMLKSWQSSEYNFSFA